MGLDIRPVLADELADFVAMLEVAAGRHVSDEVVEDARTTYRLDRTLAAFDGDRLVGGTGSDLLELTVPGPSIVAAARITHTGVLPTHRRRGLVTALWVRQLRELRDRGEVCAVFTTSGPGIYRRVGYSPATMAMEVEIETAHARLDLPAPAFGGVRLLDAEAAAKVLPELFDLHRRSQPGQVGRPGAFWPVWFLDRARYRKSEASERFAAVFEDGAGEPAGYLTYRLVYGSARDEPVRGLEVEDLVTVTEEARRALWAYCVAFDQAAVVGAPNVPVDEPLLWMLADPRRLRMVRLREFLWLRLIDLPAALGARRYRGSDELVFDVADPVFPENAGTFRLAAGPGHADCERTSEPADVVLGVADLAAAYLGGVSFTTLARAGRATELTAGSADRSDALFASRPAPWTVTDW